MSRSLNHHVVLVAVLVAGCTGTAAPSEPPATVSASPPSASAAQVEVPPGRIVFYRHGSDGVEHYFTINTDGTDERVLFDREDCAPCVMTSPDGTQIWTLDATGHGTWSFATMKPDGSDPRVIDPAITTLNLAPYASSADGRLIAFGGWDETDSSRNGVYVGSPDLTDLKFVSPPPDGTVAAEAFGVTPDGSHIVFFADRGMTEHPAGDLYVVNANGSGLRQINPAGTTHNMVDVPAGSLSPDGGQVVFGVEGRIYIAGIDGGDAKPITRPADFVYAVSWDPTGEWITYTRQHGTISVVSLVRPDGTDQHEISPALRSDEVAAGVWSRDGKYLLVERGPDGARDLWIMDREGTYAGQVTHEPSTYGTWSWASALDH
jgi:hypothetical protein